MEGNAAPGGPQVTTITMREGFELPEGDRYEVGVAEVVHLWRYHSAGMPEWVESDDPEFADALAGWFGCDVGRPEDW
jgi:hypothetical protein